eukprot:IDg14366t1
MEDAKRDEVTVSVVRHDVDGGPLIDMSSLRHVLQEVSTTTTIFVELPANDGICMIAVATAVYGCAVEAARPTQDVVLRRGATTVMANGPFAKDQCTADSCTHGATGAFGAVAVGGTFDRLHAGHRLLLTAAAWAARDAVWVGVAGEPLLSRKSHRALISPLSTRLHAVDDFIQRAAPSLVVRTSELRDSAGVAGSEKSISALVVSRETLRGARRVNEERASRGLPGVAILAVDVLFRAGGGKLSSSALRARDAEKS